MTDQIAVLVVEDEALILFDIVDQLEAEGFKTYEATNADDAIALLVAHSDIRVICTDIDMPGSMDGLKLAAAVRDRWPPVKIIVTSGRYSGDAIEIPEGSIFLSKPCAHSEISNTIHKLMEF